MGSSLMAVLYTGREMPGLNAADSGVLFRDAMRGKASAFSLPERLAAPLTFG